MWESIGAWSDLTKLVVSVLVIISTILSVVATYWTTKRDTKDNTKAIGVLQTDQENIKKELHATSTNYLEREASIRSDTISGMEKIKEAQNQQIALMHELHRTTMDKIQEVAVKAASK